MNIIIYLALLLVGAECSRKLPSFVDQCYIDSQDLEKCVLNNIVKLKPKLLNGVPELQLPSLNPLDVSTVALSADNSFHFILKNLHMYNVVNCKVTKFKLDLEKMTLKLDLSNPILQIDAHYTVRGKFIVLKLDSEGECRGNLTGLKLNHLAYLEKVSKHGYEFLRIKNSDQNITLDDIQMEFDNLFGDNKDLNEKAMQFVSQSRGVVLEEFTPFIRNVMHEVLDQILQNVLKKYPLNVLLPTKP